MNKKGIVWWKVIMCIVVLVIVISTSFILGRVSRNAEVKSLNNKIKKLTVAENLNSTSKDNETTSVLNKNKNTNANTSSNNTNTTSQITQMKLNEPYLISNSYGEYSVTFEGIRETLDRNQFSDITPKKVIFVDYSYENISCEEDVYVSEIKFKVLDDSGNVLSTYPVSDSTKNHSSVPIGGKSSGADAFAIMTDTKSITILYYDYGRKPLGKLVVNL